MKIGTMLHGISENDALGARALVEGVARAVGWFSTHARQRARGLCARADTTASPQRFAASAVIISGECREITGLGLIRRLGTPKTLGGAW